MAYDVEVSERPFAPDRGISYSFQECLSCQECPDGRILATGGRHHAPSIPANGGHRDDSRPRGDARARLRGPRRPKRPPLDQPTAIERLVRQEDARAAELARFEAIARQKELWATLGARERAMVAGRETVTVRLAGRRSDVRHGRGGRARSRCGHRLGVRRARMPDARTEPRTASQRLSRCAAWLAPWRGCGGSGSLTLGPDPCGSDSATGPRTVIEPGSTT